MSKRREDLIIPYKHVPAKPRGEASGMVAQTLPMAAMFLRNKMLSWTAFFLAVQSYLAEPLHKPANDKEVTQPPLLRVLFAFISLATCYIDIFFPSTRPAGKPFTQKIVENVAESITSKA